MLILAGGEQFIAHKVKSLLDEQSSPVDIGSPLVGHAVALSLFGVAGAGAFVVAKRRIETGDDIVEPAYPEPPASPEVTAGPNSNVAFDAIGKEGRRFVLMALTAPEISAVMNEPARTQFGSSADTRPRHPRKSGLRSACRRWSPSALLTDH